MSPERIPMLEADDGPVVAGRGGNPTIAPDAPLELAGVAKRWRGGEEVLRNIDLRIVSGTRTWVSGRNGAGKTTLLRIAAGVVRPDAGHVRVCGIDPERERVAFRRQVGLLAAVSIGLYARLTVRQHLAFWADIALLDPGRREESTLGVVERLGLEGLLDRRVDRISMGQRQRTRLAAPFLHDPALVLLDEPENSLDAEGVECLGACVDFARQRGSAILWCSPAGQPPAGGYDRQLELQDGTLRAT